MKYVPTISVTLEYFKQLCKSVDSFGFTIKNLLKLKSEQIKKFHFFGKIQKNLPLITKKLAMNDYRFSFIFFNYASLQITIKILKCTAQSQLASFSQKKLASNITKNSNQQ